MCWMAQHARAYESKDDALTMFRCQHGTSDGQSRLRLAKLELDGYVDAHPGSTLLLHVCSTHLNGTRACAEPATTPFGPGYAVLPRACTGRVHYSGTSVVRDPVMGQVDPSKSVLQHAGQWLQCHVTPPLANEPDGAYEAWEPGLACVHVAVELARRGVTRMPP